MFGKKKQFHIPTPKQVQEIKDGKELERERASIERVNNILLNIADILKEGHDELIVGQYIDFNERYDLEPIKLAMSLHGWSVEYRNTVGHIFPNLKMTPLTNANLRTE